MFKKNLRSSKKISNVVWKCFECENSPIDNQTRKLKLFESYEKEIICKEKNETVNLLYLGNNLNKNFEFKLKKWVKKQTSLHGYGSLR